MNAIAEQEVEEIVVETGDVYTGMCATCQDRAFCVFRRGMRSRISCCEEYVPETTE